MGLRIMQYRAGVIDATLEVRRRTGQGTDVICQIKNQNAAPPAPPSSDLPGAPRPEGEAAHKP